MEIGSTLRAARERRGLERCDVERETRIRDRYLGALEEERFDVLPGRAYAKGFLRVYADFLGLDGRLFVDEFNARFPEAEEPELTPRRTSTPGSLTRARRRPVVLGVLAAVVLGVLAWRFGGAHHTPTVPVSAPPTRSRRTGGTPVRHPPRKAVARVGYLVLHARGPCWVFVRVGSETGPVLYEATLSAGQTLRYTLAPSRPLLWVRIGAPSSLDVLLNGRAAATQTSAPTNIVVSRQGIRAA